MADRLEEAFRALREEREQDGKSPAADATLARVLASARTETRRRARVWKLVLPIAAVLVASSAWAGATGRLASVWSALTDDASTEAGAPRAAAPSTSPTGIPTEVIAPPAPVPSSDPPPSIAPAPVASQAAPTASVALAPPRASSEAPSTTATPNAAAAPTSTASAAPVASQDALAVDKADFEAAYRVHASGAPSAAVTAWDDYLTKHPRGRFGPEARYARAVALVRSGQTAAARQALRPFADAAPGAYRRDDALRLLESLGD